MLLCCPFQPDGILQSGSYQSIIWCKTWGFMRCKLNVKSTEIFSQRRLAWLACSWRIYFLSNQISVKCERGGGLTSCYNLSTNIPLIRSELGHQCTVLGGRAPVGMTHDLIWMWVVKTSDESDVTQQHTTHCQGHRNYLSHDSPGSHRANILLSQVLRSQQ